MSRRPSSRPPGLLRRFGRDRRGVSAVEFAMLAPVMIVFYFGLAEFCQGYMADKRSTHATSLIADLVAQSDAVTGAELDDIFQIGAVIMKPFPASALQVRVSSITRGTDGVARVDWSRSAGMSARAVNQVVDVPTGLIANGQSLVLSESTYDYRSPANYLMPGLTRFSHTYYLRPREVERVAYTP